MHNYDARLLRSLLRAAFTADRLGAVAAIQAALADAAEGMAADDVDVSAFEAAVDALDDLAVALEGGSGAPAATDEVG